MTENRKNSSRILKFSNFQNLSLLTIAVVYVLILIGGIVRSTGSGMGCPDWPTCFGQWVPPTDVSQLPANYQEIFGTKLKGEVEFNALKTWIEYFNRLFGVLTGIFIFGTLLASIPYLRKDKPVFYISLLAFLLVAFQGWLGAKVVAFELAPYIVTLHMMLALVIVFLLLYVMARTHKEIVKTEYFSNEIQIKKWLWITFVLSMLQIALGTQVREAIDEVAKTLGEAQRGSWIENLGLGFYIHRSYSILLFGVHSMLLWLIFKNKSGNGIISQLAKWLLAIIIIEILTGVLMAYFAIPAYAQPIHLTLGTIAVGIQFVAILLMNQKNASRIEHIKN